MKKKKIIIVCIFLTLITITALFTVISAVKSYKYDMDPTNGVDILEGFGAVLIMMVGGFVVFYELDLFYTVYYFLIKPKTIAKSIIVIFSNVTLLFVFFADKIIDLGRRYLSIIFESSLEEGIVPVALFLVYAILKMLSLTIGCLHKED